MSFAINDTLVIFQNPTSVTPLAAGSNPNEVNAIASPVQLGGDNGQVYTTISGGTIDNTSAGDITLANNNPQKWNGDFAFAGKRWRRLDERENIFLAGRLGPGRRFARH
jgi:hypothetical protein